MDFNTRADVHPYIVALLVHYSYHCKSARCSIVSCRYCAYFCAKSSAADRFLRYNCTMIVDKVTVSLITVQVKIISVASSGIYPRGLTFLLECIHETHAQCVNPRSKFTFCRVWEQAEGVTKPALNNIFRWTCKGTSPSSLVNYSLLNKFLPMTSFMDT